MRARRRRVDTLKASHTHIAKPAMSEIQKATLSKGRYPSWNAAKRVISINRPTRRRFCGLMVFASRVITSILSVWKSFIRVKRLRLTLNSPAKEPGVFQEFSQLASIKSKPHS